MRLINADELKKVIHSSSLSGNREWLLMDLDQIIDNAPTVEPQKVVTIPHELIEKLVLCVVDTVENIDWDKAIEAYKARPQGKWIFEKANNEHTDGYICSICGRSYHTKVPYFSEYNFCPNCGADMRGDAK